MLFVRKHDFLISMYVYVYSIYFYYVCPVMEGEKNDT